MNKTKKKKIEEVLDKICREVEKEYQMGGLSSGLYADYAKDVAKKFVESIKKEDILEKLLVYDIEKVVQVRNGSCKYYLECPSCGKGLVIKKKRVCNYLDKLK